MKYLFILDFDHLDNGLFLKDLSKNLSLSDIPNSLFLHADSAYTDRIMQTGVMRENAQIRAIKELNHRLVALFADEGLAFSALNGYQRNTVHQHADQSISIDFEYLKSLGKNTHVLLSTLISTENGPRPVKLTELIKALQIGFEFESTLVFATSLNGATVLTDDKKSRNWPSELSDIRMNATLIGPENFKTGKLII